MNIKTQIKRIRDILDRFEEDTSTAWPGTTKALKMLDEIDSFLTNQNKTEFQSTTLERFETIIPVIDQDLVIIIYEDSKDLLLEFEGDQFSSDVRDLYGGSFVMDGDIFILLCNDGKLTHGTVSHECKHAVNFAFQNVGYQIDTENDELECHFLRWVVNKVYEHLTLKTF